MKEKMLNNFSLKILSVIVAIVFWIIIVNIYDPSIKVTVSGVTVQLLNEESLSNMGYSYEIEDGSKISVYVSGPRSLVSGISASDITATVDLSTVNIYSDYVDIAVKLQKNGTGYAAVQVAPKTTAVKVNIENRATKTIDIVATVVNNPAAGYIVGDCKILPSTVTITGAQSIINSIGSVKAVVDINNAKEDVVTTCELEVYNTNGKIISKEKLDMSRKTIDVKVSILPIKEIAIEVGHKGEVANGFVLTGVEPEADKIIIAGDAYELEVIDKIVIPADVIDVSGISEDTLYEIDLNKYLPEGIVTGGDNIFKVNVRVEALNSRKVNIAPEDIAIINVADGYEAEIISEGINVTISGRKVSLEGVTVDSLKPVIDLEGIQEGNHDVEVKLTTPDGCSISGTYRVSVQVVSKEA